MNLLEDALTINLNSTDAIKNNGSMNSNVLFNTNGILRDDVSISYSEISVSNCQIPVSFYGINSNNNVLNYSINAVNYTLTITQGNYNFLTFQTEVVAKFLANGHAFTMVLNNTTGIITLQYSFASSVSVAFLSTSLAKLIFGFTTTITSLSNVAIPMTQPLNLLGQTKLKIVSKLLPTGNIDSQNTNVLQTIPVNQTSYGLITWENATNHKNVLRLRTINNIDISILDQDNNYINFNGLNWTISLRLANFRNFNYTQSTLYDYLHNPNDKKPNELNDT